MEPAGGLDQRPQGDRVYLEAGGIQKAVAAATHASLAAEGVAGVTDVIRRLLPLVREGSREAALLLARGAAAASLETGSDQPTQRWFSQALAIASSHDDAGLELQVLAQSISVDHFALRWHDTLVKSRRVLELAGRVDELHWQAYASYRAAFALTHAGRIEEANGQVQENLAAAERLRDRDWRMPCMSRHCSLNCADGGRRRERRAIAGWRWRPVIYRFSMYTPL